LPQSVPVPLPTHRLHRCTPSRAPCAEIGAYSYVSGLFGIGPETAFTAKSVTSVKDATLNIIEYPFNPLLTPGMV
jgi:hypothetical protein